MNQELKPHEAFYEQMIQKLTTISLAASNGRNGLSRLDSAIELLVTLCHAAQEMGKASEEMAQRLKVIESATGQAVELSKKRLREESDENS